MKNKLSFQKVNFRKKLLFFFCLLTTFSLSAQNQKTITGTVTDSKGETVIGATVLVQGTSIGTITDASGEFSLDVEGNSILTISYLGFKSQNVTVDNRNNYNIILIEDGQLLDELVVVGYGVVRKRDLTGSTVSVGSDVVKDKPVSNIAEALQGRAAGVMITNTGAPGSNSTIRIRGLGSINDASPLIVIDGVPTDLNLNAINQNDVETIDILKDASATAIYGSRGANGVVIITTKKGKKGQGVISFSANTAINNAIGTPKMLNASQFASLHNEMMLNGGQPQRPDFSDPTLWDAGTDWYDALIQTGNMQNYLLSYSGGGENNTYYVSAGIFDQKGIVINTDFKRYTFQFNNEANVRDWLKFGNNLTLSHDVKRNGSYDILGTMRSLPTQPIYEEDGSYSGPGNSAIWYGDMRNPIGTANVEKKETKGYNLLANIYGEVNILKKVYFRSLIGVDYKDWSDTSFSPKYDWKPIPVPYSSRSESWNKSLTYLWDNTVTYIDTFAEKHHLNLMLGSSAQNNVFRYMNGSKEDFISDDYNELNNGLLNPLIGGGKSEWALLSFFGRANYNYDDRYLLTATIRRDGTSRISSDNRWGTFPSFSAAWRFTEEAFYPKNDILTDGKLRIGYGETGNQAPLDPYAYITRLKTAQYVFNGTPVSTLYPLVMPSPDIKWETVKQWNVGIDAQFFKQRLSVTLDAYVKNTSDMLVGMAVPITTGYSDTYTPQINVGKVRNRGFEFTLSSRNIMNKKFEWTTEANFSYNQNEVLKLDGDVPMYFGTQTHTVGKSIGAFYGYVTNGIFQNWDEVNSYAVQKPAQEGGQGTSPGDIRFKDLDNNGVIDDNDRTFLGNPTPSWIFSMNNSFNFCNFDLQIYFQGVAGNKIYNGTRSSLENMSTVTNQSVKVLDRWTGEGTSNFIPRAVYADPNNNNRVSDRYIENGSYLRLKNVTFGYTLPEKTLSRIFLSNARFFVSAQNLLTFTRYSGFDPEVSGLDSGSYPMTRTISFGLDVKF
ncbi:TonB-dependent receptor [Dysgonomonas sp. 520]|uniref:SusC/RagA family TonB-linked outer membrane protein n=1 Tax=Dysgonomonas sp. 520 TaxID=2302931 RepID=UPI0013D1C23B|nr:TonB-dependent receptor [Dysgonomonas sp. 520]NDW11049.1 TonB-dependent receptor [Dysgonomonas sp. 520]